MSNTKFIILIVVIVLLASSLFTSYYLLIARSQIKADCMNTATRVVSGSFGGLVVDFDEARYKECIKFP